MQHYNKAIVAAGLGIVFVILSQFGVTEQTTLYEALEMLLVAGMVYFVPNKKV